MKQKNRSVCLNKTTLSVEKNTSYLIYTYSILFHFSHVNFGYLMEWISCSTWLICIQRRNSAFVICNAPPNIFCFRNFDLLLCRTEDLAVMLFT
jgi:hypothetical protein